MAFAAFCGAPLEFDDRTSWAKPVLDDWTPETIARLRLDTDGFYFRKAIELTDACIEAARGKFIVAHTSLNAGADALAALRGTERLCLDLAERPDDVKALLERITDDFLAAYDAFHVKLAAAGMPSSGWIPGTCRGRFRISTCDFSCLISERMFEDLFIPSIERVAASMDRTIYHMDGRRALRHLDRLMDIPDIHAFQWVPDPGIEDWRRWVDVYRRIQRRGKSFTVAVPAADVEELTTALRPEGAWLTVSGVENQAEADAALKTVERWTGRQQLFPT
jgi:hypothetical protein